MNKRSTITPTQTAQAAAVALGKSMIAKGTDRLGEDLARAKASNVCDMMRARTDGWMEAVEELADQHADLLSACKAGLQEVLTAFHAQHALSLAENNPAVKQLRAAIAKATGGEGGGM